METEAPSPATLDPTPNQELPETSKPKPFLTEFIDFRSEKNLAVAILRQAWHEAVLDLHSVKETSRDDYRLLKKKAIEWITKDGEGFPYWCKLADVDHRAIRKELDNTLQQQHF